MLLRLTPWIALPLLLTVHGQLLAARALTPDEAQQRVPFKHLTLTGRFDSIHEAEAAAARRAEKLDADGYVVTSIQPTNQHSGNSDVYIDLYRLNALPTKQRAVPRRIRGVRLLNKAEANRLEPFATITLSGLYSSQPDMDYAVAKVAKTRGAAAFYITQQRYVNNHGGNQLISVQLFSRNAKARALTSSSARLMGATADNEGTILPVTPARPPFPATSMKATQINRVGESSSLSQRRYTVTLADGKKIEEINAATAAQKTPFKKITFSGHFSSPTDLSVSAAKRAAKQGAAYYHIAHQAQNRGGGNVTVVVYLYH